MTHASDRIVCRQTQLGGGETKQGQFIYEGDKNSHDLAEHLLKKLNKRPTGLDGHLSILALKPLSHCHYLELRALTSAGEL